MTPEKVYTKEGVNNLFKDISAVYELQDTDITIVGPGVIIAEAYEVILSQNLIDVIVEGKKPIFVNATLMSALTNGEITTQMLFNNITTNVYNPLLNVDNLYTYSNISGLIGISVLDILIFKTNDKYYIAPHQYSIDLDMYVSQSELSIFDLGNNQIEINYLGNTYTAGGGSTLYLHRIRLYNSGNWYINMEIINNTSTLFNRTSIISYLPSYSSNFRQLVSGYKLVGSTYTPITEISNYNGVYIMIQVGNTEEQVSINNLNCIDSVVQIS